MAPDGAKLSKRKHGAVVSVTTYRDAGFLPRAYVNFLCLLGWSPKGNREQLSRRELIDSLFPMNQQTPPGSRIQRRPFTLNKRKIIFDITPIP